MKKDNHEDLIFFAICTIPIIWSAVLIAPYMNKGLLNVVPKLNDIFNNPFSFVWCENSIKTIFLFLIFYLCGIAIYYSNKRNYRRQEEYGSAKWANPRHVNRKYADKHYLENKLLSQNVRIGLNGKKHRRNLNSIIIGGSGAGKTRFYGKPNLMQCNTSFVVLDPKGELLRDTGYLLEREGYVIKVVDLIDMTKSHGYNPFHYIRDDKDVLKLITNLIKNTTPKGAQSSEPFWEKSEIALLEALCLYLIHEAPPDEQNFNMVMEMIGSAKVMEEDEEYQSPLDELFERLEMRNPDSLALKQYNIYKQAAGVVCFKRLLNHLGSRLKHIT